MYGAGQIGYSVPAHTYNTVSTFAAHTQAPCVWRFAAASNTTTSYIVATVYTQYGLSGQDSVEVTVSFENSLTQYLDITDVLRSGLLRTEATATWADTMTPCRLRFEEFNSLDTSLGVTSFTLQAYDSTVPPVAGIGTMLPDTFRMLTGYTDAYRPVSVALTDTYYWIDTYDSSYNIDQTYTTTNGQSHTAQIGIPEYSTYVQANSNNDVVSARVIWEPCDSDHMQLRWWSPVTGGWKSCAVKIRGGGYNVGTKADYITMFDKYGARDGSQTLSCVIENCTPADVQYYSDIYLSDQVECSITNFTKYNCRLTVEGTPPAYGKNGYTDLEFDLTLEEVSTLC